MKKATLLCALLSLPFAAAFAQSSCNNQDFEDTSFVNWSGATGTNPGSFLTPNTSWVNGIVTTGPNAWTGDANNRMTVITNNYVDSIAIDPVTLQPDTQMTSLAPNGGSVSVRLGNSNINMECEKLVYQFTVSAGNPWFQYQFATVMEDPGHNYDAQPFFMVNIWDQSNNLLTCCSDTIWSADPTYPFISTTGPNSQPIQYRRWTPVSIDLSAYAGQTMTIEFVNSDCAYGGHFGYTYLDVSCFGGPIANVWPGDCDYDLQANNMDLIPLALSFNTTGPGRSGASNSWTAQASADWTQSFAFGLNYKHSDCNGDGIIDLNDTLAIYQNYGQNHPFRLANPDNGDVQSLPQLYLVPVNSTVAPGGYADVDVYIGSAAQPISSLSGLSFDLGFDNTLVLAGSMSTDFSASLLGTKNVNMMTLAKENWSQSQAGIALCKMGQVEVNGYGYLGRIRFTTASVSSPTTLNLSLANVHVMNAMMVNIPVSSAGTSILIDPSAAGILPVARPQFSFYPNPATQQVVIHTGADAQQIVITDALGREVYRAKPLANETAINLSGYVPGIYFICVTTPAGNSTQQLIISE